MTKHIINTVNGYTEALNNGATHEEILEVSKAGRIVSDYAQLRNRGLNHSEAIAIADWCEAEGTLECDTCHNEYTTEPKDSFQTYNGNWFCSNECGKKAGW